MERWNRTCEWVQCRDNGGAGHRSSIDLVWPPLSLISKAGSNLDFCKSFQVSP